MDHPVGQRESDAAALGKAGHHAAGHPEPGKSAHRPDQRVSVRSEGEGPIDDLLDPGFLKGREVTEADLQRRSYAIDIRFQQLMAEIPWRDLFRPWLVGFLIGAHEHAAAL